MASDAGVRGARYRLTPDPDRRQPADWLVSLGLLLADLSAYGVHTVLDHIYDRLIGPWPVVNPIETIVRLRGSLGR